jgi:hypothetical protein
MRRGIQEKVEAEHIPLAVPRALQRDSHLNFYDRIVDKTYDCRFPASWPIAQSWGSNDTSFDNNRIWSNGHAELSNVFALPMC